MASAAGMCQQARAKKLRNNLEITMKENGNNSEITLCCKCKFWDAVRCHCPELSPYIWDYVEPRIETLAEVQAALSVCTQQMLKERTAAPRIASAVATVSGKCKYFKQLKTNRDD